MRSKSPKSPLIGVISVLCVIGCFGWMATESQATGAKFNRVVDIEQQAPEWNDLPGVDGKRHGLAELRDAKLVVVIFLRNHCPIAQGYAGRIREFVEKYRDQKVMVVGINVSDEPGEDLEQMKTHAAEHKFPFLYLRDASQKVGKAYGATNTPHVFVLDSQRHIAYMGAIDDHNKAEKVSERFLEDAVQALLAGQDVDVTETLQRGCQILYRGE